MTNQFDITAFGAIGDGTFDCTQAIQAALDAAGKVRGEVCIPPGQYITGAVKVPPRVCVTGAPAWCFRENGASTLLLRDAGQPCLLDITGAVGCTLRGVCLDGRKLGRGIHGILLENESMGFFRGAGEDCPTIEDCRVVDFTGDAAHLECVWCFTVRRNHLMGSGGHGLLIAGCDGFITENWFTGNRGAGLYVDCIGSALSITNNRVEWNYQAGFYLRGAETVQCTGNFFDRQCGPAIDMAGEGSQMTESVSITGNIFRRGGWDTGESPPAFSSHILMRRCVNVSITGNTFRAGGGDGADIASLRSPRYSIVLEHLRGAVIANNAMHCGALERNILDLGGHEGEVLIAQNAGLPSNETSHWLPKLDN